MLSLLVVVGVVLSLAGCEKDEVAKAASEKALLDDALAEMRKYRDTICTCTRTACSDSAFEEYKARAKESLERLDRMKLKFNEEQSVLAKDISDQMGRCILNLRKKG